MKFKHLILPMVICFSIYVQAQKIVDSTIRKLKTEQELTAITKVNNKVNDKISRGIDKIFDHPFRKKNKDTADTARKSEIPTFQIGAGKSIITIAGTNYSALSSITEALKSNPQVRELQKEFSNGTGTLKITHSGSADQVLDDLLQKAGVKLEVVDVSGGRISLKIKID